jgi:N-acetylmuramoyl-L-alanine amidase
MVRVVPGQGKSLALIAGSADYVINGGFFDWGTGNAVGHLKADGKVLAKENWNCWGMRWDKGQDIRMDVVPNSGGENYISGVELLTPGLGPKGKLSYTSDVGGVRGRTAIGLAGDCLVLYCSGDGTADAKKPEALRDELVQLGCDRAIMLDSGGSSQCSFPDGEIKSARCVHNYIAVWLKKKEGEDEEVSHKVVLDPGHGVETAGKCSPDKSYYEHEFNLDVAGRVKAHLERHGVSVTMTRADEHDVTLAQRVKVANDIQGLDLFCSIHSNASGEGWTEPDGYGIYTSAKGDTAARNKAAKAILARVKAANIQLWGDGLFHNGSLYVLKNTTAPAVLIEHGFHTNINEVALLKHDVYRDLLAKVDAQGILDYLGIAWVDGNIPKKEEPKAEPEATEEVVCVCPHCGGKLKIEKG